MRIETDQTTSGGGLPWTVQSKRAALPSDTSVLTSPAVITGATALCGTCSAMQNPQSVAAGAMMQGAA